jgi:hypothetical protein
VGGELHWHLIQGCVFKIQNPIAASIEKRIKASKRAASDVAVVGGYCKTVQKVPPPLSTSGVSIQFALLP